MRKADIAKGLKMIENLIIYGILACIAILAIPKQRVTPVMDEVNRNKMIRKELSEVRSMTYKKLKELLRECPAATVGEFAKIAKERR